jgi:hypothetical protein
MARRPHPLKVTIRGKVLRPSTAPGAPPDELAGKVLWSASVYRHGKMYDGAGSINLFDVENWIAKKYPTAHVTLTKPLSPSHPALKRGRYTHHTHSR